MFVCSKLTFSFIFRCLRNGQFREGPKIKVNLRRNGETDVEEILYNKSFDFPSLWYNFAVILFTNFLIFLKSFGGKRLYVASSMTLSLLHMLKMTSFKKWPKKNCNLGRTAKTDVEHRHFPLFNTN